MSWLIDTNISLRGLDRNHPHCRLVRRTVIELKRQGNDLFVAPQNLVEFWPVATRPAEANGLGMSTEWTAAQIARMKGLFNVLAEGKRSPSGSVWSSRIASPGKKCTTRDWWLQ